MSDEPTTAPEDETTAEAPDEEQDRLDYVDPDEFDNLDEADSDEVEQELPEDSFDEDAANFEAEHD